MKRVIRMPIITLINCSEHMDVSEEIYIYYTRNI